MRKFGQLALWTLILAVVPFAASAEEAAAAGAAAGNWGPALGAGIAIGLAALGCSIGQGMTASNTTAGIARNPSAAPAMFVNYILGMVLIESIAIYGLVIAFMLVGKA